MPRVRAVRSVDLAVTDMARARDFYTNVWNLAEVEEADGVVYLRATGAYHHVLSLRTGPRAALIRVVLDAADQPTTKELFVQVGGHGALTDGAPRPLHRPGDGYGFGFKDPEGRNFAVVCDVADHPAARVRADRPAKLSHVNLNCGDNDNSFAFTVPNVPVSMPDWIIRRKPRSN